jgi:hypothetical protein
LNRSVDPGHLAPVEDLAARARSAFDAARYFEAHEAWEDLWRAEPPGPRKQAAKGLAQWAAALVKRDRGEPRGAQKLWAKARATLEDPSRQLEQAFGISLRSVRAHLSAHGPDEGLPRLVDGPSSADA